MNTPTTIPTPIPTRVPSATVDSGTKPFISVQPQGITVVEGTSATFSVSASGTGGLLYQWFKDGELIPNALQSTFTLDSPTTVNSGGNYTVVVSNSVGSITSQPAVLTVISAPSVNPIKLIGKVLGQDKVGISNVLVTIGDVHGVRKTSAYKG